MDYQPAWPEQFLVSPSLFSLLKPYPYISFHIMYMFIATCPNNHVLIMNGDLYVQFIGHAIWNHMKIVKSNNETRMVGLFHNGLKSNLESKPLHWHWMDGAPFLCVVSPGRWRDCWLLASCKLSCCHYKTNQKGRKTKKSAVSTPR